MVRSERKPPGHSAFTRTLCCAHSIAALAGMLHAMNRALVTIEIEDLLMHVGPARSGAILEVGESLTTGRVIHAMRARPKFLALL